MVLISVGCLDFDHPRNKACDYCITDKPDEGEINIKVSISSSLSIIPVKVYEGNYESGKLLLTIDAESSKININLPVNKRYTFAAEYRQGGKTTIVLNTGKTEAGKVACYAEDGETITHYCWYIDAGNVDLRLKDVDEDED